jgi:hypothetical protein
MTMLQRVALPAMCWAAEPAGIRKNMGVELWVRATPSRMLQRSHMKG